ncbi:hypothetical protein LINGRAHAP2_LOCUS20158 [Linum grandiflorum]
MLVERMVLVMVERDVLKRLALWYQRVVWMQREHQKLLRGGEV